MIFYNKQIGDFLLGATSRMIANLIKESLAKYFKDKV
ncbi:hypothetical protein III_05623 [Bacillus mycoides]|uniref:Uncharacterized protein n=1 Tax=Bacillus mycoides TaxID=1405 RepID=A0ABC9QVL1_BACMY|nr:hypothetical protein III_05623 [Bacillus mycoides]